jgi:N-formylglutamate amidohydrolase
MIDREREAILSELSPPCLAVLPIEQSAPFVFSSPHSGRTYPSVLLAASRLDAHTLRKSEDCYVDDLLLDVPRLGAPLLAARFPRAYLDVNREPYELDPRLFLEAVPPFANAQSPRVAGGLGTIARIVAENEEIYREPMPIGVAFERIERLYKPFHATLAELLDRTQRQFGYAILVDCHSMPSASLTQPRGSRPDFVLGDRFGASCHPRLSRLARETLVKLGYNVHQNRPYAGGYITEHYGRPHRGLHALQLEINRALYLDERTLAPTAGFAPLKATLATLASRLFEAAPALVGTRAAAE